MQGGEPSDLLLDLGVGREDMIEEALRFDPPVIALLDERGYPTREMGILESPRDDNEPKLMQGALCNECGNHSVIRKDGCDFCTACGAVVKAAKMPSPRVFTTLPCWPAMH